MPLKQMVVDARSRMRHTIDSLLRELATMRTGRATVSMLDGIRIDYYGTATPLNQVGSLTTPDPTLITIQPWDPTLLPAIEKAIRSSVSDGTGMRMILPSFCGLRSRPEPRMAFSIAGSSEGSHGCSVISVGSGTARLPIWLSGVGVP